MLWEPAMRDGALCHTEGLEGKAFEEKRSTVRLFGCSVGRERLTTRTVGTLRTAHNIRPTG